MPASIWAPPLPIDNVLPFPIGIVGYGPASGLSIVRTVATRLPPPLIVRWESCSRRKLAVLTVNPVEMVALSLTGLGCDIENWLLTVSVVFDPVKE